MSTDGRAYIVKTPGVCWGHARIRDTRISVKHVIESLRAGATPADLVTRMPHVTVIARTYNVSHTTISRLKA